MQTPSYNYGEDVNYTITSSGGCGSGMNDLLDKMNDMRGGSDDIYIAVLPPLLQIQTPGSNIGGCGKEHVAAVFIDFPGDMPHEVGHALNRNHAPCNPGQCNPMPANVDPNYPQYSTFPAGSIGAFGFDPVGYAVKNPASTFDFMAYEFPEWVSAYTYLGLAGSSAPSEGGTSSGSVGSHAITNVQVETLFLGLEIYRDDRVWRRPSFHFKAKQSYQSVCEEYTVELLDVDREVLVCMPLSCDCNVAPHCWPRRFRTAIPYPKEARWLLIWHGEHEKMYEEWIPRPPKVEFEELERDGDEAVMRWRGMHEGDEGNEACRELWYLLQWYDAKDDVWRGVAPRTRHHQMRIPPEQLTRAARLPFRVLCTSGIATGEAYYEVEGKPDDALHVDIVGGRRKR